ncbi:hypothetical protein KYJ26_16775 [Bacillus sp. MCCB 382]|uniref:hypothetical protein n=1 Tax=Bacillus sp. MCCB 382 TaxID=2860197 RepID=UPI001C59457C|nr:hypothetical protein [Bacillus sp. MCCB 382]
MGENVEVIEFVDNLERLWNGGEMVEVSYRIASLYAGGDYSFIIDAMSEFKKRIGK